MNNNIDFVKTNQERIDVDYRYHEHHGSIIEARYVALAFAISILYHLVLLIFLTDPGNVQTPLVEFWLFVLSDVALWTIGLIPLFAFWRKLLPWYDPFFLFMMVIFGTFSTAFFSVCIDPGSAAVWMSYGGINGFDPANASFYLMLFQAEIIIFVFMFILLLTNRKTVRYQVKTINLNESKAALITSVILSILGIYGFFYYWGERSFIATVLSANGNFTPDTGSARFLLFQGLANTAISLGLIGWLCITGQSRREQTAKINWFPLAVIFCTLIPNFVTGSRLDIFIALITPIAVLRFFNFSFGKRILGITAISLVLFWSVVTIIRGNPYTRDKSSAWDRLNISEAINNYSHRLGTNNVQLLYADRVGNIAYIVKNLSGNDQYLYGQTLIAGLANYAADFSTRLNGDQLSQRPFLMAYQYLTLWRFGNPYLVGWPVPPSIEGEFYMQGGYITVIILSYLLGIFFSWSRQRIAITKSFVPRWVLMVCLIKMAFYFTMGEVSTVYTHLIYLVIIMVAFYIIYLLLSLQKSL